MRAFFAETHRALLAAVVFAACVHGLAAWGEGRMTSPLRPDWDAAALAEAPPLARFDAGWYRSVAKEGYSWDAARGEGNVMLFPLYPLLWRPLWWAGVPLFWAGLLLAHLAFFVAVALLATHAAREWGEGSPGAAVVALLAFPWAFYLLAPYAESLFLALALGAFAAARRRRWALVALLGLLAGLTRIHALALVPALAWIAWRDARGGGAEGRRSTVFAGAAALGPALGVAAYFAWLATRFGDPFLYLNAQRSGWGRAGGLSGLGRSLGLIGENLRERGLLHLGPAVDLLAVVFLIVAAVWCFRRGAAAEGLYVAAGALLVVGSGSLLAAGRYALVLFPIVRPLLALRRRPVLWYGYLAGALLLQAYLVVRFVNNLWVA